MDKLTLNPAQLRWQKEVRNGTNKSILSWDVGIGKTIGALIWAKEKGFKTVLVICPKRVRQKWIEAVRDLAPDGNYTVMTKEEFKKEDVPQVEAIIGDEFHWFCSPLFLRSRSLLSEKLYKYIKQYNPEVLGLTATPVCSSIWNLHTALALTGKYIDWKKWRSTYSSLQFKPYLARPAWFPNEGWQKEMGELVKQYCDMASLEDKKGLKKENEIAVPIHTLERFVNTEQWEASALFYAKHKWQASVDERIKALRDIGEDFSKVIVSVFNTDVIDLLAKELKKDRQVFVVDGRVKDQETIIREANNSTECYLIVQSSCADGWDGETFDCVVFYQMGHAIKDEIQTKGRVRVNQYPREVNYYYLILETKNSTDEKIYQHHKENKDFIPSTFTEEDEEERS
jgi:superfamily II DNA or RNA helicase